MSILIKDATLVNEGRRFHGSLLMEEDRISRIYTENEALPQADTTIEAEGAFLLPGIIDGHVHMREPGLTQKADMESETRAAAAGGVTSVLDMPNVNPLTTTCALLEERYRMAADKCHVNYGFFLGATNQNLEEIKQVDPTRVPGVKLFMGSSTGNMLVDKEEQLIGIFQYCPTLIMAHCEDTTRINACMKKAEMEYGLDPDVTHHAEIRDAEACYTSTHLAIEMARKTGAHLHVAHLTTARELTLFSPNDDHITAEACIAHLLYTDKDYARLGTRIKCNPSIKTEEDRKALRAALVDGCIRTIGTDHAPHLLSDKEGGCKKAASGMPMVQFSVPTMLELTDEGILSIERMVELMCHNPARLFRIRQRGFLREGYQADLTLVRRSSPWQVTPQIIQSKCGWSPREGDYLQWHVCSTWVNGQCVWDGKQIHRDIHGLPLQFR